MIRYFKTQAAFRTWLEENHDKATELYVGMYKKHTGKPSITYHEALDEALCFGWIDGVRHSVDDERFKQRFTPRKARSNWSHINIARVAELKKQGLMHEAGLHVFESRERNRDTAYSREAGMSELSPAFIREFKQNKTAWQNWNAFPPGYRRTASWWVMSAKREDTRARRLNTLIDDSAAGQRIAPLTPPSRRGRTN
jgi:uncharacterized protein YdeI (YjbR/CyaY-like superfamily)